MISRRFEPHGPLALEPSAFGMLLMMQREPMAAERRDGVSIVAVRGPLMHHRDPQCDSYDEIKALVASELAERPRALVLRIDSPGGLVAGCFSTAREIRSMASAAGVPVYAYVDGAACSAAYALACAASRIVVPEAGMVGSIGVRVPLVDATQAAANQGVRVTMVSSGARKADGDPSTPFSEAALRSTRETVESLARVFFAWVAETRGVSAEAIAALEGAQFTGAAAVPLGLADGVSTFEDLLASIASAQSPASAGDEEIMNEDEKARAALKAIVDGDGDEKSKARARKALAAMDDEKDEDAKASEPPPPEPKKDEDAKASEPPPPEPKKDEDAKAIAQQALATAERVERDQLLATRPDIDDATKKLLATAPIAHVREYVATAPRRALNPAATAVVAPTRAAGQGGGDRLPADQALALDVEMGLALPGTGVRVDGNRQVLGVMTRAQARAELARKAQKDGAAAR